MNNSQGKKKKEEDQGFRQLQGMGLVDSNGHDFVDVDIAVDGHRIDEVGHDPVIESGDAVPIDEHFKVSWLAPNDQDKISPRSEVLAGGHPLLRTPVAHL